MALSVPDLRSPDRTGLAYIPRGMKGEKRNRVGVYAYEIQYTQYSCSYPRQRRFFHRSIRLKSWPIKAKKTTKKQARWIEESRRCFFACLLLIRVSKVIRERQRIRRAIQFNFKSLARRISRPRKCLRTTTSDFCTKLWVSTCSFDSLRKNHNIPIF